MLAQVQDVAGLTDAVAVLEVERLADEAVNAGLGDAQRSRGCEAKEIRPVTPWAKAWNAMWRR